MKGLVGQLTLAGAATMLILPSAPAVAFPPYRSTDADTAGDNVLELRLGLVRIQKQDSQSTRSAPLGRMNIGMGDRYEIITEFDYSPETHELGDGALGFKWARLDSGFGIGVETLLLLPVQSTQGGVGIESQFLTTLQRERWELHANIGAFQDGRAGPTEEGWRASLLAEFPRERFQPGLELFAKDSDAGPTRLQAGVGFIAQLERFDVRSAIHVGLNRRSPDLEFNLWFAWRWQLGRSSSQSIAKQ